MFNGGRNRREGEGKEREGGGHTGGREGERRRSEGTHVSCMHEIGVDDWGFMIDGGS